MNAEPSIEKGYTITLSSKMPDESELHISTLMGDHLISIQKYIVDQTDRIILDAIPTDRLVLLQKRIADELLLRENKKEL